MAKAKKKNTSDAVDIIYGKLYKGKPDRLAALEKEYLNAGIARAIYDLRTEAGLTQKQLAKLVGTQPSAISRLEDADYDGHSLSILRKIAAVFGGRIQIRFVPAKPRQRHLVSPNGSKMNIEEVIV
jgi:DNA-binding XRE family transcriptional regulator